MLQNIELYESDTQTINKHFVLKNSKHYFAVGILLMIQNIGNLRE